MSDHSDVLLLVEDWSEHLDGESGSDVGLVLNDDVQQLDPHEHSYENTKIMTSESK